MRKVPYVAQAFLWFEHARNAGARFDVETKAAEAVRFSLEHDAADFAIPSKLEGTSRHQRTLAQIARTPGRWQPLTLVDVGDQILAVWHGAEIGHVRPKHVCWLRPLLRHGLCCYVSAVTGGTPGRKTRGCNVVFGHVAQALAALHQHEHDAARVEVERLAEDARRGAAYVQAEAEVLAAIVAQEADSFDFRETIPLHHERTAA